MGDDLAEKNGVRKPEICGSYVRTISNSDRGYIPLVFFCFIIVIDTIDISLNFKPSRLISNRLRDIYQKNFAYSFPR